ncbi:trace amine-associated receptor 1-like [Lepisosteus oculatus]|uniref:trace amine-associated receptor 1-like n=1 Tax=Lepisosteus oculatus TaxID=7918 RepID=UPI0035F50E87
MLGRMSLPSGMSYNISELSNTPLCYESLSGSCARLKRPFSIRFTMYMFMVVTILITVCGNLLVITSIAHFKQLHTSTNYLILSLAVCDFLLGLFVMPCSTIRSVDGCWYLGDFLCKIHTSTDIMLSTSSIFHLSFISIDRYFAVCKPLKYETSITPFTILTMIICSWILPGVFAYGMIFLDLNIIGAGDSPHRNCIGGCTLIFNKLSGTFASMISFFIPGFVMLGIYLKIYLVARSQARSIKDMTQHFQIAEEHKSGVQRQREKKAAKTLGIVMGVFLICWTPFFVCNTMDPFIDYSVPPLLVDALVWFGYLNSAFNPIVYAFFYSWFRRALRIIVFGKVFHPQSCRTKLFSE